MACMRDGFEQGKLLDNRFMTIAPLNHGSFGMVFTARDKFSGLDVAIKCITKPGTPEAINCPAALATDDQSEELAIHAKLPTHKHIVNLIHTFETQHHQYMVLELCGNGDLYEAIRLGKGPLETEHVRDAMMQLLDSVEHMHAHGVYHRDIKPENIFLTASGTMKIGDFGLATTETWSTEFAVGSDRYMAPEQFDASVYGYGYSPASADVWAIGIVLLNILFQRNPFATPTMQDPLFVDFAKDRQSLFDVFPTMSQDTYNVLRHSLALDPANRSLAAVREALKAVVSFTTDDESLDDFCTEQSENVPMATAAREPLRTPSITSPTGQSEYPWSSMTSPLKTMRHLPTIPDEEVELFPGSVKSDWQYVDADEASLSSNVDSGLGMSYKSSKSFVPKPSVNFVGSLPISFTRPGKVTSPYGASGFSKSWSDLWDEDMEDDSEVEQSPVADIGIDISRVSTAKPSTPQMSRRADDDLGSITPRPAKVEPDRSALSSGTATPMPESKPALAKTKSSSILDKWAALGNFRRAKQDVASTAITRAVSPTPAKTRYTDAFANFAFGSKKAASTAPVDVREHSGRTSAKIVPSRARAHSANGNKWDRREHSPKHPPVPALPEQWSLDNNWREHKPPAAAHGRQHSPVHITHVKVPAGAVFKDDIGDLEWVGGWKDFHI